MSDVILSFCPADGRSHGRSLIRFRPYPTHNLMTPEEWNELRAIRLTALNTAAQLIAIGAVSNNVSDIIRAAELIEEYLTKQSE